MFHASRRTKVFCASLHFARHARKLLVAGVVPHRECESFAEDAAERLARRHKWQHWIEAPVKERNKAKPPNRNQHGNEQRNRKPSRDLDSSRIEIGQQTQHDARARPLRVTRDPRKIFAQVIHQQHAVEAVQQKRSRPIPPAALKSPEIAERGATPAIETTLHGENAIKFGGSKRNWNRPEHGNKCKEHKCHPRPRTLENFFEAKWSTCRVAIKQRKQRQKTDLTQMRRVRIRGRLVSDGFAGHMLGV